MQQALAYNDESERLEIAKQFAMAAAHNIRENLKYYSRRSDRLILKQTIDEITSLIQEEKETEKISDLMLIEGRIRRDYYNCLNDILPADDFPFIKRSKQPPEDPINSLISFGNTLLYRRIAKEIYKSKLDIKIGFLHATNRRYESLHLDIAEIFRPVIVDRIIFTLINKKMINEQLHFENLNNNAVYLNKEGKKIFVREFELKMAQKLKQENGCRVSYGNLIKAEIRKLIRYFEKGEEYRAFKYFL